MTKFRPCIDLHNGKVKQIVGGTLTDSGDGLKENFVSDQSADAFAEMYRRDKLEGGHVIQLGPGNQEASEAALRAYPGGLQLGGGVKLENAVDWLQKGASHVIVTSWLFDKDGTFSWKRLKEISREIGKQNLVIDLSCRTTLEGWTVAMNRWQTLTDIHLSKAILDDLAEWCDEFLIHAADVEGLCKGIDGKLVKFLGEWSGIPMTYAGGVGVMQDVLDVAEFSKGNVDITVGSALDVFGGNTMKYAELVDWNIQRT